MTSNAHVITTDYGGSRRRDAAVMSPRQFAALVAAALLIAGIIGLSVTVTATTATNRSVECGTGWAESSASTFQSDLADAMFADARGTASRGNAESVCEEATTDRRLWAWPLVGLGAIGLFGALVVRREREEPTARDTEPTA
ncbi:hypothetical protein [Amycolatopsis suaedae]|uniref:Uncharacterized protein n=1 Tax=Amycolatopsis suaedae TaxID=2510978 RepID=A0A4V2EL02_9PSEU|nr:hypothetical protein [Amycolatopsis suaedae]RZQ59855.1 hypothetical protein EWH70_32600 [Amycolatopsis suaedae]